MFKVIIAYVFAFFVIGWGSGLISLLFTPLVLGLRNTKFVKFANFLANSFGTFLASISVILLCKLIGIDVVLAMFVLPFFAMMKSDAQRIHRAKNAYAFAGIDFTENPEVRPAVVATETMNLWADVIGIVAALIVIAPKSIF